MSSVQIWFHDANRAIATCGPLLIQIWRGRDMYLNWSKQSEPIFEHMNCLTNGRVCVLVVVEPTAVSPRRKARIEMDRVVAARRDIVHASAVVSTGTGLRNMAVRSIISAINVLNDGQMHSFDSLDSVLRWLRDAASIAGLSLDAAEVHDLLAVLRVVA